MYYPIFLSERDLEFIAEFCELQLPCEIEGLTDQDVQWIIDVLLVNLRG